MKYSDRRKDLREMIAPGAPERLEDHAKILQQLWKGDKGEIYATVPNIPGKPIYSLSAPVE